MYRPAKPTVTEVKTECKINWLIDIAPMYKQEEFETLKDLKTYLKTLKLSENLWINCVKLVVKKSNL
jgi:hypothetical protein